MTRRRTWLTSASNLCVFGVASLIGSLRGYTGREPRKRRSGLRHLTARKMTMQRCLSSVVGVQERSGGPASPDARAAGVDLPKAPTRFHFDAPASPGQFQETGNVDVSWRRRHPQDRLFCEIAIHLQVLTRQQATSCMQAQEREAVGQSVATVALAFGYMDQAAVDAVVHQQQRVLERRGEAREVSRMQREVESRAAAGLGVAANGQGGIDAAIAPTDRPPAPRHPSVSGAAPRRDAIESVPAAAARSAEAGSRYSGTFGEARHSGSGAPRNSGFSEARASVAPGDDPQSPIDE